MRNKKSRSKPGKPNQVPYQSGSADIILLENAILSLPEKERIIFVLHDIVKYTSSEVADLMFVKEDEINETIKLISSSLSKVGGIESSRISFAERVALLPFKISPANDLWSDIVKELHKLKAKSHGLSKTQVDEERESGKEEKKGFFWFKKK